MNPNYVKINVEEQEERKDSVLWYYRKLIALRKSQEYKEVFTYGDFAPLYEDKDYVYAYERKDQNHTIQIMANFGQESAVLPWKISNKILLNNLDSVLVQTQKLILQSGQVIVIEA